MRNLDLREKAELLRHLAHPTRLLILEELSKGVKCVTDIRDLLEIPQSNVSQHLMVLRQARIVDFYEDAQLRCYYLLRPSLVRAVLQFLSGEYPVEKRERESVREEGRRREAERTARRASCHGQQADAPAAPTTWKENAA